MSIKLIIQKAQKYMRSQDIDGWLLYDYRGMNPIFWDTVGHVSNVTRPCWLWIPSQGDSKLLTSYVDRGRFTNLNIGTATFVSRQEMTTQLTNLLKNSQRIAMEYTPHGALPRISKVDGGTLEMVKSLGVGIVSSADLLQYATQRWDRKQLKSQI